VTGIAIGEHTFETAPLFDHAGKKFRSLWIESRIKPQRSLERDWRSGKMRERGIKGAAVGKTILDRNVVPAEYLEQIQMYTTASV
jgi:hypothetical protein